MAYGDDIRRRPRALALGAAIALTMLVGIVLFGHRFEPLVRSLSRDIGAIALNAPAPPPPAPPAERPAAPEPEGAAAPPNRRNDPTPVVAPPPRLPPQAAPPAAPIAGTGSASESGAAAIPGPGTGAGGEGSGRGAGDGGDGTGGGGGAVRARHIRGGIGYRDWPRGIPRADRPLRVEIRYRVEPNGRISNCEIQRSSGIPELDLSTCRLAQQRFRYAPARNAAGEPIRSEAAWRQDWWEEP